MKNLFLTEIAKDYNADIKAVEFTPLKERVYGEVHPSKPDHSFMIFIDKEKMRCSKHILFVLFHEIGHVQLHFLDKWQPVDEIFKKKKEEEANRWAFKELGMIDNENRINSGSFLCYDCLHHILPLCEKSNIFVQK